jgi:hypothetical protein
MAVHTSLEIISTRDSSRWAETLEDAGAYDFYHTSAYHRLAEINGDGEAVMLAYRDAGCVIAFPMLLRDIRMPGCDTINGALKDATSVYGYPGPVASWDRLTENVRRGFIESLRALFKEENIVSAFSRLHPFLDQPNILSGYGEAVEIGATIAIDLTEPPEVQRSRYRRTNRQEINQLKNKGFTCEECDISALDDFLRAYHETMDRAGAEEYYYFNKPYFEFMLREMAEFAHLFSCKYEGKTVCAGIFSQCKGFVQAHLAGTLTEYARVSPMKLVFDTVRQWGYEQGARVFNIGGGVGGRDDSLLAFKRAFSDREHTYSVWRHVVDDNKYQELHRQACGMYGGEPDGFYFPIYRHPGLKHEPIPS